MLGRTAQARLTAADFRYALSRVGALVFDAR
jgi:hypothetical protein